MSRRAIALPLLLACSCPGPPPANDGGPTGDAGLATDAGSTRDAGIADDAGLRADAGTTVDAGSAADAGPTADAGGTLDGGTPVADAGGPTADAGLCSGCQTSALFPADWTPALTDGEGRFLHDFSWAGYRNGEQPPLVPGGTIVSVLDHGADPTATADSTAAFQAAIDEASIAGGVVVVPAGDYVCADNLAVHASNVVLHGDGANLTHVAFTRGTAMTDQASITFSAPLSYGADLALAADANERDTEVRVADASSLTAGDDIVVGWVITADFIAEHDMTGTWVSFTGQYKEIFRRTVTAIDTGPTPHTITVDVPLRYPVKTTWLASVRKETGHLVDVGVESLALSNAIDWDTAWTFDRAHVLLFDGVKDGWIRNVSSFASPYIATTDGGHLMSGGIKILRSKRVTVSDAALSDAQNRGGGGNGYLFEISKSNEVLIRDSSGDRGRHNFIQNWDFGTTGCVFLRTESTGSRTFGGIWDPIGLPAYSEFHHSLAMANLIDDSLASDGWQGHNRGSESSGAGHTATGSVFWNLRGGGRVNSWQYGLGYVIGTQDITVSTAVPDFDITQRSSGTAPEDYTELIDEGDTLWPPSLYEAQRARRLAAP